MRQAPCSLFRGPRGLEAAPLSAAAGRRQTGGRNPGCRQQPQLSPPRMGVTPDPHPFPQQMWDPGDLVFVETKRAGVTAASWRAYQVQIQDLAPRAANCLILGAAWVSGYLNFPRESSAPRLRPLLYMLCRCGWWLCPSNWEDRKGSCEAIGGQRDL